MQLVSGLNNLSIPKQIAGNGDELIGGTVYVDLNADVVIVDIVFGCVVLETSRFEQDAKTLAGWTFLHITALEQIYDGLAERTYGSILVDAVVDVDGGKTFKDANS